MGSQNMPYLLTVSYESDKLAHFQTDPDKPVLLPEAMCTL